MLLHRAMTVRLTPALIAAIGLALGAHVLQGHAAEGVALLPDLDQEVPANLVVSRAGSEYVLGFRSAVRNVGDGPLIISGHRFDRGMETMAADQEIQQRGAASQLVQGVGRLRYVVSPDHRHWHLLDFERYELRRPGTTAALVGDSKTGFCLGDRYAVADRSLPARAPAPVYTSRCGLGEPALLGVGEGISVGYGDDYAANLEGQYLPLTGLSDGRYVLVHRVNVGRRLKELRYDNDAASTLLQLRRRDGVPHLTVLAKCPESAECDRPNLPRAP
jgi:Lysyl oxidase